MKKKVWLVVLLLSVIVIMPTNVSNAITRKVIITKSDFKKIGYADVVVEWGLIFTDSCGAATVATDENYPTLWIRWASRYWSVLPTYCPALR